MIAVPLRPLLLMLLIVQLAGCTYSLKGFVPAPADPALTTPSKSPAASPSPQAAEAETLLTQSLKQQPLTYADLLAARALWAAAPQNPQLSPQQAYNQAKALCWLDAATFEFTQGRSNIFRDHAYRQALHLRLLPSNANVATALYGLPIQGDAALTALQKQPIIDANTQAALVALKADAHWHCATAALACAEVALVHASSLNAPPQAELAQSVLAFSQLQLAEARLAIQQCQAPAPIASPQTAPLPVIAPVLAPAPPAKPTIAPAPSAKRLEINAAPAAEAPVLLVEQVDPTTEREAVYFHWQRSGVGDLRPDSALKIEALADRLINKSLTGVTINLFGSNDPRERNAQLAEERSKSVQQYLTTLLKANRTPLPQFTSTPRPAPQGEKNRVDIEWLRPDGAK